MLRAASDHKQEKQNRDWNANRPKENPANCPALIVNSIHNEVPPSCLLAFHGQSLCHLDIRRFFEMFCWSCTDGSKRRVSENQTLAVPENRQQVH